MSKIQDILWPLLAASAGGPSEPESLTKPGWAFVSQFLDCVLLRTTLDVTPVEGELFWLFPA